MTSSRTDLINGYLDETLSLEQHLALESWIRDNPEHAKQFIEATLLHDQLRSQMLAVQVMSELESRPGPISRGSADFSSRVAVAIAFVAMLGLIFWIGRQSELTPALSASEELQRVIRSSEETVDRTYVITAIATEGLPDVIPNRAAIPSINGAMLHVRGHDQYVLIRFDDQGTRFITGSNGETAWSVPPRGRVRISRDPSRFRGVVPGQQHAIPFIEMRGSLKQLEQSYDLALVSISEDESLRCMVATRKENTLGGPKRVTLWYDDTSGAIHRMLMERLPQARGGPRSVLLELIEQSDLGPDFFDHTSHHDTSRTVIEE